MKPGIYLPRGPVFFFSQTPSEGKPWTGGRSVSVMRAECSTVKIALVSEMVRGLGVGVWEFFKEPIMPQRSVVRPHPAAAPRNHKSVTLPLSHCQLQRATSAIVKLKEFASCLIILAYRPSSCGLQWNHAGSSHCPSPLPPFTKSRNVLTPRLQSPRLVPYPGSCLHTRVLAVCLLARAHSARRPCDHPFARPSARSLVRAPAPSSAIECRTLRRSSEGLTSFTPHHHNIF